VELSVVLVGDRRMSRLHQEFLGIAGPTDVLTFELDQDGQGRVCCGEVILCVPEAARAAAKNGTSIRQELLLYALHGMLHLCGWDDRTTGDFERMHRMEDDILKRLGIGAVFSRREARSRSSP
jgi:probable rRNA maturation factor